MAEQDEKERLVSECRDDRVSLLVLQDRGVDRSLDRGAAKRLCLRYQSGDAGGEIFIVQPGRREAFDEQPVLPNTRTASTPGRCRSALVKSLMLGIDGRRSCEARKPKSEVKRGNRLNCRKLRGIIVKQPLQSPICLIICMKARLALLAAMCAVVVLSACGDPTNLQATAVDLDRHSVGLRTLGYSALLSERSVIRRQARSSASTASPVSTSRSTSTPIGDAVIYPVKLVVARRGAARPWVCKR